MDHLCSDQCAQENEAPEEILEQWSLIESVEIESVDKFWISVYIFNKNMHTVVPSVCGSVLVFCGKLLQQTVHPRTLMSLNLSENENDIAVLQKLKLCGIQLEVVGDICDTTGSYIMVQRLILKVPTVTACFFIVTYVDHASSDVIFLLLQNPEMKSMITKLKLQSVFPVKLCYEDGNMKLMRFADDDNIDSDWLKNILLTRLSKWARSASSSEPKIKSLSLIDIDEYVKLYNSLKEKYGSHMVKIWPERTDPQKFVYEDVAIATYLLLLWRKQREEIGRSEGLQTFVDLGCGNGLLVYILSSEGHAGKGLDIRKRAIWDYYPQTTQLQVDTITPSDDFLFPETDWIIGNHSDELTPWIPVIAARSSNKCCFFLLPCCFYDFSGCKYQRQNSTLSQYADYLEYIKNICKVCGFETQTDRLKIPSTKRICLIGSKRTYTVNEADIIHADIQKLIKGKKCENQHENDSKDGFIKTDNSEIEWISGFKARDAVEKVRNCTQLDIGVIDQIVTQVTQQLLSKSHPLKVLSDDGTEKVWNSGEIKNISEIASSLPISLLHRLKNECGGLQTLLKNNHHIFLVSDGKVQLRTPENMHSKTGNNKCKKRKIEPHIVKHKIKPCWFHNYHPNGCPLPDEVCTFKH